MRVCLSKPGEPRGTYAKPVTPPGSVAVTFGCPRLIPRCPPISGVASSWKKLPDGHRIIFKDPAPLMPLGTTFNPAMASTQWIDGQTSLQLAVAAKEPGTMVSSCVVRDGAASPASNSPMVLTGQPGNKIA